MRNSQFCAVRCVFCALRCALRFVHTDCSLLRTVCFLFSELSVDVLAAPPFPIWAMVVLENYGKFKNSTAPYLLWEPSDEESITLVADLYLARVRECKLKEESTGPESSDQRAMSREQRGERERDSE